ncbi:hypothetical protein ADUPG1_001006 [Aduncisulcus paluster]|uniref:Uncharacterized protein n=1 Tax=Aduncisulcus paluster TaxID=2918883 RepID=A0ABQ5KCV3_9EUKA|nr:hypothetical protein ADUPG1_001006 [Aduncisulcus paluster]
MTGTPGPGNIASMALGQAVGFKRSIPFLSGVSAVLKVGGLVYILYLAWKVLNMQANSSNEPKAFKFVEAQTALRKSSYLWAPLPAEQLSFTLCGALQVNLS